MRSRRESTLGTRQAERRKDNPRQQTQDTTKPRSEFAITTKFSEQLSQERPWWSSHHLSGELQKASSRLSNPTLQNQAMRGGRPFLVWDSSQPPRTNAYTSKKTKDPGPALQNKEPTRYNSEAQLGLRVTSSSLHHEREGGLQQICMRSRELCIFSLP